MDPTVVAASVAAVIGAALAAYQKFKSATEPALSPENVLLDRIEELTKELAHERERADGLEAKVAELEQANRTLTSERDTLADRVTKLEAQVELLIPLLSAQAGRQEGTP